MINRFEESICNIQIELTELKRINKQLEEENILLRKELEALKKESNTDVLLETMFNSFSIKDDKASVLKKRIYTKLAQEGFQRKSIKMFEGSNVLRFLQIPGLSYSSVAILVIVLKHYDITIALPKPNTYYTIYGCMYKFTNSKLKSLERKIDEYKDKIVFNEK